MTPIIECCIDCCLDDIKCIGNMFTWNNKQHGYSRIYSKLDRVVANEKWQEIFSTDEVHFMPEGEYDHSPLSLDSVS